MKKLLYLLLLIPFSLFGQARPPVEINYSADYKKNIQVRDTSKLDKILFEDGTVQNTAYSIDSVANQISDSLENVTTVESDPIWTDDSATYISKSKARSDIHDSIAALTIGEPLYEYDSAYLKSNTRELLIRIDTTQELVSRTIYVSMPTDPQTPGNDVTGTGTALLPFSTIGKAFSTIKKIISTTIIIQLDSGSFTVTEHDYLLLQQKEVTSLVQKYGDASKIPIIIQGKLRLIESITGTKDGTNPFKYNCTSVAWSVDQHEGRFAYQGTGYYPIESNTASTLNIAFVPAGTFTGIYEIETILNITSNSGNAMGLGNFSYKSFNGGFQKFRFKDLKFNILNSGNQLIFNQSQSSNIALQIVECSWIANIGKVINFANTVGGGVTFQQSFIKTTGTTQTNSLFDILGNCNATISNNVIKSTTLDRNIAIRYGFSANGAVHNNIFSGIFAAYQGLPNQIRYNQSNFYKGVSNVFYTGSGHQDQQIYLKEINTLYFENVTNLCNWSVEPILVFLQISQTTGYTNIFHTSSLYKNRFIIPDRNIIINIANSYPEYQQKVSVTLANNSTDSISIADLTYNRSIEVKLNLIRGTDYQTKTIKILNTGSVYSMVQLGDSIQTGDLGVRFDGVFRSGGSNILKLKWHTTNTGTGATVIYDGYRQNY